MRAHQAEFPVTTMDRVLGVSPSGFYAWLKRKRSERARSDDALVHRIREIHERSRRTYGAPRIRAELAEQGLLVSRKRIARLMKQAGLAGISRRKGPRTTRRDPDARPAPDRVERRFEAEAPNRLWVADITHVPTLQGFLYLAVVLDVFSRRIVGWAMESHLRADLVLAALNMAIAQPRRLRRTASSSNGVHLSPGGKLSNEPGPPQGSVGDCYDNAMAESFFASLECELIDVTDFRSRNEAKRKSEVFRYIEAWYNPHRRHSGIGHRSPVNFEKSYYESA